MDIRQATSGDVAAIRDVARASLSASYDFLGEDVIEEAVATWYDDESMERELSEERTLVLVAEDDDEVAGFSQSVVFGSKPVGEISWLHVHPAFRNQGVGDYLFERTRELLGTRGADRLRGVVLEENEAGREFYADHGLEPVGEREVDIGDETHVEYVYEAYGTEPGGELGTETRETEEGETVYLALDEPRRGRKAPFVPVYSDPDHENLYGWHCGNCDSLDTAMDTMDRMVCNRCDNQSQPTRWDAAYL